VTIKRIVLIPFWVQDILARNKMQLADCLNVAKLKPIMALNDLLAFAALQRHIVQLVGAPVIGDELYWIWAESVAANPELKKFLNESISVLSGDPTYNREIQSRLFDPDAHTAQYEKPFITYDLSPEVLGVVIYPGYFTDSGNNDLQKSLVSAILKLLYVYEHDHKVAKTPLFKRYLELLSAK